MTPGIALSASLAYLPFWLASKRKFRHHRLDGGIREPGRSSQLSDSLAPLVLCERAVDGLVATTDERLAYGRDDSFLHAIARRCLLPQD